MYEESGIEAHYAGGELRSRERKSNLMNFVHGSSRDHTLVNKRRRSLSLGTLEISGRDRLKTNIPRTSPRLPTLIPS